jgi:hypothetical protein
MTKLTMNEMIGNVAHRFGLEAEETLDFCDKVTKAEQNGCELLIYPIYYQLMNR